MAGSRIAELIVYLAVAVVARAQPDVRELVRKALEADEKSYRAYEQYTYLERVDRYRSGRSKVSRTHEISMLEGSPYRRLIAIDGKPVSPEEQTLQQKYFEHNRELRKNETAAARRKRIAEYEEKRDRFRKSIREIPEAFDFRITGEQTIRGRPAWVVEATPRRGYRAKTSFAKAFHHMRATVSIDKETYNWVSAKAELVEAADLAWFFVVIGKGSRGEAEQERLSDGSWVPARIRVDASFRILIKSYRMEEESTYEDYRNPGQARVLE